MAYKDRPEQEEPAEQLKGQMSLFDDIAATLNESEANRNDPQYIANDLLARITGIDIMLERGSNPDRIAIEYRLAAADARRIAELTGDIKYLRYANLLDNGAEICPLIDHTDPQPQLNIVFTPDIIDPSTGETIEQGQEFILPEQMEEYRKSNPVGAEVWEQEQSAQEAQELTSGTANDLTPQLNRNFELWKAAIMDSGGVDVLVERMATIRKHLQETIIESNEPANGFNGVTSAIEVSKGLVQAISNTLVGVASFINSDTFRSITEGMERLATFVNDNGDLIEAAANTAAELQPVIPFMQQVLAELKTDPEYKDITLTALLETGFDEDGNPTESKWSKLLERAKERKAAFDAENAQEAQVDSKQPAADTADQQEAQADKEIPADKKEERVPKKASTAERNGAIMGIGGRLFVPSDPEFQNSLVTSISANTGLFRVDKETGKRELALDIPSSTVLALAKVVLIDIISGRSDSTKQGIPVYLPALLKEMEIDINHRFNERKDDKDDQRGEHKAEEHDQTEPAADTQTDKISRAETRKTYIDSIKIALDEIWGRLPNDTTDWKLFALHGYDTESDILYFESPYLRQLIAAASTKEAEKLSAGYKYYNWHCDLLHANAANERNQAAVEMATRILVGVQQRGMTPDSKLRQNKNRKFTDPLAVTWEITCTGLIEECPQIRERLKNQKSTSAKTQLIKRSLNAMYKILRSKSDLYSYYKDVYVQEVIPTAKTMNVKITVTHHGGNPNYQRPPLPLGNSAAPAEDETDVQEQPESEAEE